MSRNGSLQVLAEHILARLAEKHELPVLISLFGRNGRSEIRQVVAKQCDLENPLLSNTDRETVIDLAMARVFAGETLLSVRATAVESGSRHDKPSGLVMNCSGHHYQILIGRCPYCQRWIVDGEVQPDRLETLPPKLEAIKQSIDQRLMDKLDLTKVSDLGKDTLRRELRLVVERICETYHADRNPLERHYLTEAVLDLLFPPDDSVSAG